MWIKHILAYFRHLPGGAEENIEAEKPVSGMRTEFQTSPKQE
jgi:hypothetical protein